MAPKWILNNVPGQAKDLFSIEEYTLETPLTVADLGKGHKGAHAPPHTEETYDYPICLDFYFLIPKNAWLMVGLKNAYK